MRKLRTREAEKLTSGSELMRDKVGIQTQGLPCTGD